MISLHGFYDCMVWIWGFPRMFAGLVPWHTGSMLAWRVVCSGTCTYIVTQSCMDVCAFVREDLRALGCSSCTGEDFRAIILYIWRCWWHGTACNSAAWWSYHVPFQWTLTIPTWQATWSAWLVLLLLLI
jgi:hypothetical protein